MEIIQSVKKMQEEAEKSRSNGKKIGFVPTMGYLHDGHISLVKASKAENDITVVSIFVNPEQFSKNEDLSIYPRDLERDKLLLQKEKVDILFHPSEQEIYSSKPAINFTINNLSNCMCGVSRPNHFSGVLLICAKLFNLVKPNSVYFGQKDFQQAVIVKKMIEDLNFDIKMNIIPTVREHSGLAMSSRNKYLNSIEKRSADILYKSLCYISQKISEGENNVDKLLRNWRKYISNADKEGIIKIDYLEIRDKETLDPLKEVKNGCVIALALKVGKTRLIDNIIV